MEKVSQDAGGDEYRLVCTQYYLDTDPGERLPGWLWLSTSTSTDLREPRAMATKNKESILLHNHPHIPKTLASFLQFPQNAAAGRDRSPGGEHARGRLRNDSDCHPGPEIRRGTG